ncbi:hypothetical protein A2456_00090 [Candidatus Nomurabacteria bacterium RIFOXYC2_FULL_36_19]|uniref:Uncharacterized protein n=3 Tax=Candidatus Nomuraibacteriota TaxID=1752729 RepID=A0A1F6YTJ2_9BACT|nr:MAG: hypothetical protein UR91_C0001G0008 [Candidatus Nomurabacteria bacterium GW2011_GWC2_35_8]OGJ05706.1 MAG: hypothetical protein A2238_00585 [Candidatus Nomurabacteria bacterium RIFOXYA2_FULL_35_9]OGJ06122.1 MAG: hypothetical protein A2192_01760 [Candidatus Nomurabacteria bacterium RIFOXYA1_FULL_35_17]OGJ09709.1 MAG: hypothetical protein A2456_00090 [Candidatus Nomurabacteria bacterium RIFOXYC2_FULL_36_19]OGJ14571.1 MAG: hypothetical protein A2554_02110 [Candidatus Nomurabacteria bacteri
MKKKFEGNCIGIDPSLIIDKNNPKSFDDFFLGLGLIYNDIKGVIFFLISLETDYENPKNGDPVSHHLGEYSGIKMQLSKLSVSVISEFLVFLRKNKTVIGSIKFKLYLKKLDKTLLKQWNEMYLAATLEDKNGKKESFYSKIARVRSTVAFHYSGENLRDGFIDIFFKDKKHLYNREAYYSIGSTMKEIRFHYCDAAVQRYLEKQLIIGDKDYLKECRFFIDKMNQVIFGLMIIYLQENKK